MKSQLQPPENSWRKTPASETPVDPADKTHRASLGSSMRTTRFEFFADQLSSTEINTSKFSHLRKFSPLANATAFGTRAACSGPGET